jgi:hypothetical protein
MKFTFSIGAAENIRGDESRFKTTHNVEISSPRPPFNLEKKVYVEVEVLTLDDTELRSMN